MRLSIQGLSEIRARLAALRAEDIMAAAYKTPRKSMEPRHPETRSSGGISGSKRWRKLGSEPEWQRVRMARCRRKRLGPDRPRR